MILIIRSVPMLPEPIIADFTFGIPLLPWRADVGCPWHGRRPMSGNFPKLAVWARPRFLERAIFDRKSPLDAPAAARRAYCLVPALRLSTRLAREGARLISVAGKPDANEQSVRAFGAD
jgi:hypothetical protein